MKIAIGVLVLLCFMPYFMTFISAYYRKKQFGKVDNKNPRQQYTQLDGVGARAVAAQQNSWEALAIYSASLLAVVASGVQVEYLEEAALIVGASRIFHGIAYLADQDKLRSLLFVVATSACFYLLYVALSSL